MSYKTSVSLLLDLFIEIFYVLYNRAGVPKWWAAKSSQGAAGLFSTAAIVRSCSQIIKGIIKISFFTSNLNF